MHSNLLLCRSHTPLSTLPLPFPFLPRPPPPPPFSPPPACLFLSSLFILIRAQPHFSLPHPTYPLLCSPATFHPPSIRQQTGNAAGSDWRSCRRTLTVSVFIIQVIAQVAAAHPCICIFMGSELGHWQDFFFFF